MIATLPYDRSVACKPRIPSNRNPRIDFDDSHWQGDRSVCFGRRSALGSFRRQVPQQNLAGVVNGCQRRAVADNGHCVNRLAGVDRADR